MSKTARDHIERFKLRMVSHPAFRAFAPLAASMPLSFVDSVPTAATNGWQIRMNPEFLAQFNREEVCFIFMHEVMHGALQHLSLPAFRALSERDPIGANIAKDTVINTMLVELQDAHPEQRLISMPALGIQPRHDLSGLNTIQVYRKLKEEAQQEQPEDGDQPEDGQPGQDGKPGQPGEGGGNGHKAPGGWDEHEHMDEQQAGQSTDASGNPLTPQRIEDLVRHALEEGRMLDKRMGKGAGGASRLINEMLEAKQDWREILREFIRTTAQGRDNSTWRRPNRRYLSNDVYMPSSVSETIDMLAVVVDTSGSTFYSDDLQVFVSELRSIVDEVRPKQIKVIYADTSVRAVQDYTPDDFNVGTMTLRGGGGTDLPVAFDYLDAEGIVPDACVIFTDGETPFGQPQEYPVLWAIHGSRRAPHGVNINL